jgi:hypothetical protein
LVQNYNTLSGYNESGERRESSGSGMGSWMSRESPGDRLGSWMRESSSDGAGSWIQASQRNRFYSVPSIQKKFKFINKDR